MQQDQIYAFSSRITRHSILEVPATSSIISLFEFLIKIVRWGNTVIFPIKNVNIFLMETFQDCKVLMKFLCT
jgi:hypothetical protein